MSVYTRLETYQTATYSKPRTYVPPKVVLPKDPIEKVLQWIKRSLVRGTVEKGLAEAQDQLGLSYNPNATLKMEPLGRHKSVYKIWAEGIYGRIGIELVVKLNTKRNDNWNKVKQEAEVMSIAKRDAVPQYPIPVPKVLYTSTADDESEVGAEFVVREYVEGRTYACAGDLPTDWRRGQIIKSALEALANIHSYYWVWKYGNGRMEKIGYHNKGDYWKEEVAKWSRNFRCAESGTDAGKTNKLFQDMKKGNYPSCGLTTLVHEDFDISNLVFNENNEVIAILDWKSMQNGSPLSDLGYFMMMFLQVDQIGLGYRVKETSRLLLGKPGVNGTPREVDALVAYKLAFLRVHFETDFDAEYTYAKAIACGRLLSVFQAAARDDFEGHECGSYRSITSDPKVVMKVLTTAGRTFLDEWEEKSTKKARRNSPTFSG